MISVVVPVYNAEKNINKCIESILEQSYRDIELILVNDGSKDNSLKICETYSSKDKRIIVLNQENRGVSSARNHGIRKAKGNYIAFVDADDWIDADFLTNMKTLIDGQNADMVVTNFKKIYQNKTVNGERHTKNYIQSEGNLTPNKLYDGNEFLLGNTPWNKLFKREILIGYSIFFKENLKNGEDFIFVLEYGLRCKKILFLDDYSYNYDKSNDSSVTQRYFPDYYNNLKKTKDAYFEIIERYSNVTEDERLYHYFRVASKAIFEEGKLNNNKNFLERYIAIKNILNIREIKSHRKDFDLDKNRDSRFFYLMQKMMKYNQPLLITLFLTFYLKSNA